MASAVARSPPSGRDGLERESGRRGRLEEAGFLPPKPENHLSVIVRIHEPAHPLAQAALDASRWYLTDGDRDDETMG